MELRDWQLQAWTAFKQNNEKGIIEAATGSGKTILGIKLIQENPELKVIIIVPTKVLQSQWHDEIIKNTCIVPGLVGDGNKDERHITVAIVNSIRDSNLNYDILILDEAHRYLSKENRRFLQNNNFKKIMCLTATLKRADDLTYDFLALKKIYCYDIKDAIQNKDLCEYVLTNVAVKLTEQELEQYKKNDSVVKLLMPYFNNDIKNIYSKGFSLQKRDIRKAIQERKTIVNNSENKIINACKLIQCKYLLKKKILVFCELIKTANEIKKILDSNNIDSIIYHSAIKGKKKEILEKFKNNECRVLLTVKALDEGLNVPDCSVGIIVSCTSSQRQIIQRVGRVLRKKDECAEIYQFYVQDTVDAKWLKQRLKAVNGANTIRYLYK